jgi:hypothetical protein
MWWSVDIDPVDPVGASFGSAQEPHSSRDTAAAENMRAGVRSGIGKRLGAGVGRWSPEALMAALAASAYAPLLVAGNTDSALVVTGAAGASVGANAISEILHKGIDRLRGRKLTLEEVEDWLAGRFEEVLAVEGRRATVLQGQLAVIFSQIGASEAALQAAMEIGGQSLQAELAAGLAQLDDQFQAVGAALGVMDLKLDEIRRDVGVLRRVADEQQVLEPTSPTAPVGVPLAQISDPFALEIHHAIELPAGAIQNGDTEFPLLPAYVERDHDRLLAQVVERAIDGKSSIAVLVGGSSTGKTRACWEGLGLLRDQPERWRLWHPIHPTRPDAALADLKRVAPHTVIWLNEAQFYLNTGTAGVGERLAAGLRDLLRDPGRGPVLILATLWPEHWTTLTTRTEPDTHAHARELLAGHTITVPDAFTSQDLSVLHAHATADLRLAEAGDYAEDGQVTQYLAGVPVLMERYHQAVPPVTKAFIHAAMDARRMGCRPRLPLALLALAAPGYLSDTQWGQTGEDWLTDALEYVTAPCNGIPGILSSLKPGPARNRRRSTAHRHEQPSLASGPHYRLADYLDQHSRRHRTEEVLPVDFWAALAIHADPGDQATLGEAALVRGLYRDAAQLFKNAITHGNPNGAWAFIPLMVQVTPTDVRPAEWAAAHVRLDDPDAVASLLNSLRGVRAGKHVSALLARGPAAHARLDDTSGVARLLDGLR